MSVLEYIRCPKCKSLLEITGTFNIFAPNPFKLKCPVCGIMLNIDNFGSYNWKVTNIVERRNPNDTSQIIPKPEEIIQPEEKKKLTVLGKIESGIKTLGIWVVIVLILILAIRFKK